jgi:hypothetical protein
LESLFQLVNLLLKVDNPLVRCDNFKCARGGRSLYIATLLFISLFLLQSAGTHAGVAKVRQIVLHRLILYYHIMSNTIVVTKETISKDYILSCGFDTFNERYVTEARFPITPGQTGTWEYKLFDFAKFTLDTKGLIEQIEQAGYKPAKIGHLVSFFRATDHSIKSDTIIALGSKVKLSFYFSPSISKCSGKWELNIGIYDLLWDKAKNIKFLAVKRIK